MKTEIKILHTMSKLTKEGQRYTEYICLVIINGREYIQSFRDFDNYSVVEKVEK